MRIGTSPSVPTHNNPCFLAILGEPINQQAEQTPCEELATALKAGCNDCVVVDDAPDVVNYRANKGRAAEYNAYIAKLRKECTEYQQNGGAQTTKPTETGKATPTATTPQTKTQTSDPDAPIQRKRGSYDGGN